MSQSPTPKPLCIKIQKSVGDAVSSLAGGVAGGEAVRVVLPQRELTVVERLRDRELLLGVDLLPTTASARVFPFLKLVPSKSFRARVARPISGLESQRTRARLSSRETRPKSLSRDSSRPLVSKFNRTQTRSSVKGRRASDAVQVAHQREPRRSKEGERKTRRNKKKRVLAFLPAGLSLSRPAVTRFARAETGASRDTPEKGGSRDSSVTLREPLKTLAVAAFFRFVLRRRAPLRVESSLADGPRSRILRSSV